MEQKPNPKQNSTKKFETTQLPDNTKPNTDLNKNQNKSPFCPKHENSIDFKKIKKNFDEILNFHGNFPGIRHDSYYYPSSERLNKSIVKLQTSDDMDIITELISLCDFLSLSSDKIGFDPKMQILLEEIFKNLEKTYLPELIIYCLQCINYILDINPSLYYIIQKIKGVPKLLNIISSVEDITCIDYIIKIFDKIVVENSRLLLENNVFMSLMNILGFFNIEQKKSVMKICSCICNRRIYFDEFNKYIKPSLNELINLTKIDFNSKDLSSGDIFILEKCITIYYNIINCLKNENSKQFQENFDNEILKVNDGNNSNNIIENFVNVLYAYFISDNKLIPENVIKMILKIIVIIFEKSQNGTQKLLNNKLLEIFSEIVNQEFYNNNNNNNIFNNDNNIIITNSNNNINNNTDNHININKKNINLLPDLFNILIYLFPCSSYKIDKNKSDNINDDKKILKPENKNFYDYFCKNILLPLIKNIMNKFTNQISNNLIKLILAFIHTANKADIELFLPSKPISQIIIKLLDDNSVSTITDCFSLLECLLEKAPELFIVNLIREGIVDTLRNYNLNEKIKIEKKYRSPMSDQLFSKYYHHFKKLELLKLKKKEEEMKEKKKEKEISKEKEKELTIEKEISKEKEKTINKDSESIINEEDFLFFRNDDLSIDTNKTKGKKNNDYSLENNVEIKKEKIKNYDLFDKEVKENFFINDEEDEEEDEDDEVNIKEKSLEEDDEENNNDLVENNIEDNDNYNEEKSNNNDLFKMEIENSDDKSDDFELLPKDKLEKSQTLNQKKDDKILAPITPEIKVSSPKNNKIDVKIIKNEKEKDKILDDYITYDKNKLKEDKYMNISSINSNVDKSDSEKYDDLFFGNFMKRRIQMEKREMDFEKEEIKLLEDKKNEILSKYLTEEKINEYLSKINLHGKSNLINIKNTLIELQEKLNLTLLNDNNNGISTYSNETERENCLFNIINILTNENNYITLFELENSKILPTICHFLCPVFYEIYEKIDDNNINKNNKIENIIKIIEKNKKLMDQMKKNNSSIFDNLQNFFKIFKNNQKTLKNFIKLINSTLNSINLPYISVGGPEKKNLLIYFEKYYNADLSNKIKVIYNENIYKEKILNNKDLKIDEDYRQKLEEFNISFKNANKIMFICTEYSTFKNVTSSLLTTSNIPFLSNDKYQIEIIYFINIEDNKYSIDLNYIDINSNNKKDQEKKFERFYIEENWTYREMKTNFFNKFKRTFNYLTNINFGLSIKFKDEKKNIPKEKEITNKEKVIPKEDDEEIIDILNEYSHYINQNFLYTDYINIDKLSFIKEYNENILYAKGLYFSKHLCPSLFLLNVLNLSINKYHEIFSLPNNWFSSNIFRDKWKNLFINQKLDLFISKSSQDPYQISQTKYPNLCKIIISHNLHLTKFETRLLSFKTSYSPGRSLINLQNYFKRTDPTFNNKNNITIKKNMRIKIIVERDKILEHGFNIIHNEMTSKFSGFLEFEYKNEIGNGLGPTLEFYTLIIDNIRQNNSLWYKTDNETLYPKLFDFSKKDDNLYYILNLFELLGYIIGRAIYDDRLLDIPLNKVFWCLLLKKPVLFKDIENIDSCLYNSLKDFVELIKKKQKFLSENNNLKKNINEEILYKGSKLNDLDIYFNFPGYDIELKNNGQNILLSMENIEEYVNLIYNFLLYKGISKIKQAFIKGFNTINNLNNLECFSPKEIEESICGSNESKWEYEELIKYLKPEHGYTNKSKVFLDLIKFMSNLNKEQRKKFLKFTTGCSRLPMGGFKNLSPKLTVVKKTFGFGENPDCFLPTVMTCQNYFKLPEYSSYSILESKILMAMEEGGNEFSLS